MINRTTRISQDRITYFYIFPDQGILGDKLKDQFNRSWILSEKCSLAPNLGSWNTNKSPHHETYEHSILRCKARNKRSPQY